MTKWRIHLLLSVLLFILTAFLYVNTYKYAFVVYDDELYVTKSEVTNGLNTATLKWAIINGGRSTGNWHPVTMLSLMADVSLFHMIDKVADRGESNMGLSGWMHLHNALLHALNSVLLYLFIFKLLEIGCCKNADCGYELKIIAAFFGATFWALHPLRVESVAWISSRKDVLCVCWYLIGHLVYLKYVVQRGKTSETAFFIALVCYCLAFASKPTAVTFPCTLLLMEYLLRVRVQISRLLFFTGVTAIFSVLVIMVQSKALSAMSVSLMTRIMNSIASVGDYLFSSIWPGHLAVFYPYEDPVSMYRLIPGFFICCIFCFGLSYALIKNFTKAQKGLVDKPYHIKTYNISIYRNPCFLLGCLWFLGCLIPVCGLVHVGYASHADRYTYLSGIGLSIVLGTLFLLLKIRKRFMVFASVAFVIYISIIVYKTYNQLQYWRDSMSLFKGALSVTEENYVANANLGVAFFQKGDYFNAFYHERLSVAQYGRLEVVPRLEGALFRLFKHEKRDVQSFLDVTSVDIQNYEQLAAEKLYAQALISYARGLSSAENFIQRSIQICPTDGYAYELYSKILLVQDRFGESIQMMYKAHSLLPKRIAIKREIKQIEEKIKTKKMPENHSI